MDIPKPVITETELRELLAMAVAQQTTEEGKAEVQALVDRYLAAVEEGIKIGVLPPWEIPADGQGFK